MEENKIVEELEKEIEEKRKLPQEQKGKIDKEILYNLILACAMMLFLIFLAFGYINIEKSIYLTDLKVFSLGILAISILLFEKSYQKEDGKICIWGIEVLVLAIFTLVSVYICTVIEENYYLVLPIVSYVVAIYYNSKCFMIYRKRKKEYVKSLSDISEIIKEEKPIKKMETKKRKKVEMEIEAKEQKKKQQEKKKQTKKATTTKEASAKSKKTANKKKK